jgi:integrase
MAHLYRRGRYYWLCYYENGEKIQKSLKTENYNAARRARVEIEKKVLEGQRTTPRESDLKKFYDEYKEASKGTKSPTTMSRDKSKFRVFLNWLQAELKVDSLSALKPPDITAREIQRFRDHKAKKTSKANANAYLRSLSGMFSYGVKRGFIFVNPVSQVEKLKAPQKEVRFLDKKEIKKLLDSTKGTWWYGVVQTGLEAGLRAGEIFHLEWKDIDFKKEVITVRNKPKLGFTTKSLKVRHVPLSRVLKRCLRKIKKVAPADVSWIFPNTQGTAKEHNFSKEFKEVAREAGVPWANLKALRHTFASRHAMVGRSLFKIQKWLGHADPKTTMVYSHLLPEKDKEINL